MQNYHYVLLGTKQSGKTSALSSLSEITLSQIQNMLSNHHATSKLLTLPEIEQAVLRVGDAKTAYLYSYPKQEQIDQILPVIRQEADGCVIFINHAVNTALQDLETFVNLVSEQIDNIVIAITHTDVDSQQLLKKYRNWLTMKNLTIPVFAIDPRKKEDVKRLIEVLVVRNDVN